MSEKSTCSSAASWPEISLKPLMNVSNPKSIHGIYPYRGKISAIDAALITAQLPSNAVLLDPFCGSGTIIYEAQSRGMLTVGVDNNPLACIISQGKTQPLDPRSTIDHLESTIDKARTLYDYPKMDPAPAKYFHSKTSQQIMRLLSISHDFSSFELSALYGSICVAARACNGWKWTSTSIGKINEPLRPVDFYDVLLRKARKHIVFVKGKPPAAIHHHDARCIDEVVPEKSIDVVYSSPPYFDALDYTGYYTKLVYEILGMNRAAVREGLIQRYSTYENDMEMALKAIDKVVKDDALIIFVVGDRMVHRRLIKGSEFFARIAPWGDPYIVERSYTDTPSSIWDKINRTQRKEQVIVWDLGLGGCA